MRSTSCRLALALGAAVAVAAARPALAATAPWSRLAVVPVPPPRHRVQAQGPLSAPCPLVVHALVAGDGVEPLAVVATGRTRRTLHVGDAIASLGAGLIVRDIGSRHLTLAQGDAIWRCPLTTLPRDNR